MEKSFHYLLMANQAVLHKKLLSNLKNTCLTLGQPKILDYLKDHDGASQKEIAAACYIEAASLIFPESRSFFAARCKSFLNIGRKTQTTAAVFLTRTAVVVLFF